MKQLRILAFTITILCTAAAAWAGGTAEPEQAPAPANQAEQIAIEHEGGTTRLETHAERIVVLEWSYAEDLLALGIQPAGLADISGYRNWVQVEPQPDDSVADVGSRQEPSLEAIIELEPDLIIGVSFRHAAIYDQLSEIAPTILFNPYPGDDIDQYENMIESFRVISTVTGREAAAEQVIAETDALYEQLSARIADAGLDGESIALAQGFTSQGSAQIRIFTDNALAIQITTRLGLENAWDDGFQQYGFTTVGFEALTALGNAHFFYVAQPDDDVFAQAEDNPVWQSLEFVQSGQTYSLGGGTWLFGGALSAQLVAEKITDSLLNNQQ
ncbi:MAG: ABC transporter substrate-binding protein [Spirochaeta sp.]